MAKKEVTGGAAIDLKKQGKGYQVEGIYIGHKTITTKLGEQIIYKIETDNGVVEVFGFAALNYKLGAVKDGTQVWITYEGQSQIRNRYGKFPHLVKVEIDDETGGEEDGSNEVPF